MPDPRRPGAKLLLPAADAETVRQRQAQKQAHREQLVAVLNAHYLPITANLLADAAVEELGPKIAKQERWEFPELVNLVHEWFMARAAGVIAEALQSPPVLRRQSWGHLSETR